MPLWLYKRPSLIEGSTEDTSHTHFIYQCKVLISATYVYVRVRGQPQMAEGSNA